MSQWNMVAKKTKHSKSHNNSTGIYSFDVQCPELLEDFQLKWNRDQWVTELKKNHNWLNSLKYKETSTNINYNKWTQKDQEIWRDRNLYEDVMGHFQSGK